MKSIPRPEYPRPDFMRESWMNLNGEWDFALFPAGEQAAEREFAGSREGNYDKKINVPFSWVSPLSGIEQDVAGVGWYRRTARFEPKGRLHLCFGAVDYLADVYINGERVGGHRGGYAPFELDITGAWREGKNVIEVRAEDVRGESQTYGKQGYGDIQGIWQTVWLEDRPVANIENFVFTTRMDGSVNLRAECDAPDGALLSADFAGQVHQAQVAGGAAHMSFKIESPRLWSPDDPYLYEGRLTLESGDERDVVSTYFGVREIEIRDEGGRGYPWIYLNGAPVYINGTLDQAFNPKGHFTYPTDKDMRDEAWRLKRLGLNMVRIHIKPEEPRKLYWMDKLGVLVMADMPCFWGEPDETAREGYEGEWPDVMRRDINHPSIFSWVMFNESWGLLTNVGGEKTYLPETQEWVRDVYRRAKALDPTRIVEDNSPCRYDHVETDINTWHFYINGYENVKNHVRGEVDKAFPGSEHNYIGGNVQSGAPFMNSECGMVWGVDESAGDSDIAWQYHYMLNEFRLHEKICGFVFTEFHDVVNEFNGYYRIDDADKEFGYGDYCRGMTIADLHSADFIATDFPPCITVESGARVDVPLVLSSFSPENHGRGLSLKWELWYDSPEGRACCAAGDRKVDGFGYGATPLEPMAVTMPGENALAVLSLYLNDAKGRTISRNFTTFDVRAPLAEGDIDVPLGSIKTSGFKHAWSAHGGDKLSMGGSGKATAKIALPDAGDARRIKIVFEASAKRVLKKDSGDVKARAADLSFMRGYKVDRGAFKNSYFMTDEDAYPSQVEVIVDGESVAVLPLGNDYADSRGALSWHYQADDRKLDEAGSFGELKVVEIPSRLIPAICERGAMKLTLRVKGGGGLALYGRDSGRYATGLVVRVEK